MKEIRKAPFPKHHHENICGIPCILDLDTR